MASLKTNHNLDLKNSPNDQELIKILEEKFIYNDIILYNLANKKMDENINVFGYEKMALELERYQKTEDRHFNSDDNYGAEKSRKKRALFGHSLEYYLENDIELDKVRGEHGELPALAQPKFQELAMDLMHHMVTEGAGYCGFYRTVLGENEMTDLEFLNNGKQPLWNETMKYLSEKFKS